MIIRISKMIGDVRVETDITDAEKGLVNAEWITKAPTKCSECGGTDLRFYTRVAKPTEGPKAGQTFYFPTLLCLNENCRAKAQLGKFQDLDKGYFWKNAGKFEKYNNGNQQPSRQQAPQQAQNGGFEPEYDDDGEEVPF